jgi:hypothetical protein
MPKLSSTARNALVDSLTSSLTYCSIYSGSIPSTGDTAVTGTLLVTWTGTLSWGASSSGVSTLTVPVASDTAVANGTAGYARLWDGSGNELYCTVGTSGAEVNLSSLSIVSGGTVNIVATTTITMPAS